MEINRTMGDVDSGIGSRIIELLGLKIKEGRADTDWGSKTIKGVGACVRRIVEEEMHKLTYK